jgi:glycosyltransferase involved in cell wall biosynthesis
VSDNCSTDGAIEFLEQITDSRFRLIKNEINRGATVNYMKVLSEGSGKYVMFMTDKDSLDHNNLGAVIEFLKSIEFSFGYFSLDFSEPAWSALFFDDLKLCFRQFAYLSRHPTGYIFNSRLLGCFDLCGRFASPDVVGCFPFEFLCAELCNNLRCVVLNIPFCVTSKLAVGRRAETSMSYSHSAKNLFFSPEYRFEMFEKYVRHLNGLVLRRNIRLDVTSLLLWRAYYDAVFGYLDIIKSEPHRVHYGISDDALTGYDESLIRRQFFRSLRKSDVFINHVEKTYVMSKLFTDIHRFPR